MSKPRRPSFQFYPADWLGNTNLKRCTLEEKGAWIDLLCLANDAEEYGIIRWPLAEIAQAIGCKLRVLQYLASKGVLKGADPDQMVEPFTYTPRSGRKDGETVTLIPGQAGPLWYSSRMVKDEYVRNHRGENSRFTEGYDSPNPSPNASPKPPFGEGRGDGSSSSSSSSSSETPNGVSNSCGEAGKAASSPDDSPVIATLPCVGHGPKEWLFTEHMLNEWAPAFPRVDLRQEVERMRLWLEVNPARRKTIKGMQKFALNWMNRAQDKHLGTTPSAAKSSRDTQSAPGWNGENLQGRRQEMATFLREWLPSLEDADPKGLEIFLEAVRGRGFDLDNLRGAARQIGIYADIDAILASSSRESSPSLEVEAVGM